MGIKMPETCWDSVNNQHPLLAINHLYCCILLVFFPQCKVSLILWTICRNIDGVEMCVDLRLTSTPDVGMWSASSTGWFISVGRAVDTRREGFLKQSGCWGGNVFCWLWWEPNQSSSLLRPVTKSLCQLSYSSQYVYVSQHHLLEQPKALNSKC